MVLRSCRPVEVFAYVRASEFPPSVEGTAAWRPFAFVRVWVSVCGAFSALPFSRSSEERSRTCLKNGGARALDKRCV